MKRNSLKNSLWFNVFLRIAAIFAVFVIILAVSNFGLLVRFFSLREKRELKKQLLATAALDTGDTAAVALTLKFTTATA